MTTELLTPLSSPGAAPPPCRIAPTASALIAASNLGMLGAPRHRCGRGPDLGLRLPRQRQLVLTLLLDHLGELSRRVAVAGTEDGSLLAALLADRAQATLLPPPGDAAARAVPEAVAGGPRHAVVVDHWITDARGPMATVAAVRAAGFTAVGVLAVGADVSESLGVPVHLALGARSAQAAA